MASSADYLAYVLELLGEVPNVRWRKMMGEYVLYGNDVVFGGIYDDRFLVKETPSARRLLPEAARQTPYPGAKPMLAVDTEDRGVVAEIVAQMLSELPASSQGLPPLVP